MRALTGILTLLMIFSCAQNNDTVQQEYLQKGSEIVSVTQKELLKNVFQAVKKGGPEYAVDFCNLNAMLLKDSLAKLYNCQIKRISDKYRNPLDKPRTATEIEQLNKYEQAFLEEKTLESNIVFLDKEIEYYQPIMIAKKACLNCHGDPDTNISSKTLAKIKERYPNDLATGYRLNDFRGAWKITFGK